MAERVDKENFWRFPATINPFLKKKKISGQGELTGILRKKAQDGVKLARKERSPHEGG